MSYNNLQVHDIRNRYHIDVSNELLRAENVNLSLSQHKLINVLLAFVKMNDGSEKEYTISVSDICSILGYLDNNGYYYKSIKADFERLCRSENGCVRWLEYARIEEKSGTIQYHFSKDVSSHIFDLGKEKPYTEYNLNDVIAFSHKASIRLFQLLKTKIIKINGKHSKTLASGKQESFEFDITQLKRILGAKGYLNNADFVRRCIMPALHEITKCNETYNISGEIIKKGLKIVGFTFKIDLKLDVISSKAAKAETAARLSQKTRKERLIEKIKSMFGIKKIRNLISNIRQRERKPLNLIRASF